jgi:hypothetical protein
MMDDGAAARRRKKGRATFRAGLSFLHHNSSMDKGEDSGGITKGTCKERYHFKTCGARDVFNSTNVSLLASVKLEIADARLDSNPLSLFFETAERSVVDEAVI